jgi:hypothetical protein
MNIPRNISEADVYKYFKLTKTTTENGRLRLHVVRKAGGEIWGVIESLNGRWRVVSDQGYENSRLIEAVKHSIEVYNRFQIELDEVLSGFKD